MTVLIAPCRICFGRERAEPRSLCRLMGWPSRAQLLLYWAAAGEALRKAQRACDAHISEDAITTIGFDLGKNTFHLVGLDKRGAIVLQQKVSRAQLERRLANIPRCLIGMEACSGSHHIGRQLSAQGPGAIREAVPQGPQERLPRCRSDRGSCSAADHELCRDQNAGADGLAGPACALASCQPADGGDQSNDRTRHHGAARRGALAQGAA